MIASIIWFFSWPVMILASYYFVKWSLKKFEKSLGKGA
jgi:hypothetical protein